MPVPQPAMARPLPGSMFNEYLAFFLFFVNLGVTALLNDLEAAPVFGVLGAMTLGVVFSIAYRPEPLSDRTRMRFLVFWAVGLMLLVMTGRANSVNFLSVVPNLVFLSCIPLMVVGITAPVRGFSWFIFPGFGLWMLMINLLNIALDVESSTGVWIVLAVAALNLIVAAHLGVSSGPLQRNAGRSLARASVGLKVALPSILVAFLASASLVSVRHAMGPIEFPSFPGLPAISTSSKPVLTAFFKYDAPKNPYWEISEYYVFPSGEHTWMTLDQAYEKIPGFSLYDSDLEELSYQEKLSQFIIPTDDEAQESYEYLTRHEAGYGPYFISLEGRYSTGLLDEADWNGDANFRINKGLFTHKSYKDFKRPRYGWNPFDEPKIAQAIDRVFLSLPGDPAPHLPASDPHSYLEAAAPKTVALARRLREGATDEEFIERVLAHFEENLAYHFDHQSTDPEENRLDYFLFEGQKGVCRHFANAFGMMMRLGGVPTRLVGGYAGGSFDSATNSWTVRARDAHIWNHVWLEDKGWVRIDPTSVVPVEKGVPEGAISSLFQGKGDQKDHSPRGNRHFSTMGRPDPEGVPGPGLSLPSLNPAFVLALLGLLAAAVLLAPRLRPDKVPAEDRAWEWAIARLKKAGVDIATSMGPSTITTQVVKNLPDGHPAAAQWAQAAALFEEWKYGGKVSSGLPASLRHSARDVLRALRNKEGHREP